MKFTPLNFVFTLVGGLATFIIYEIYVAPAENSLFDILFTALGDVFDLSRNAFALYLTPETAAEWGVDIIYAFGESALNILKAVVCPLSGGFFGYLISLCRIWEQIFGESVSRNNRYR